MTNQTIKDWITNEYGHNLTVALKSISKGKLNLSGNDLVEFYANYHKEIEEVLKTDTPIHASFLDFIGAHIPATCQDCEHESCYDGFMINIANHALVTTAEQMLKEQDND